MISSLQYRLEPPAFGRIDHDVGLDHVAVVFCRNYRLKRLMAIQKRREFLIGDGEFVADYRQHTQDSLFVRAKGANRIARL
jgi:hypothetical protein